MFLPRMLAICLVALSSFLMPAPSMASEGHLRSAASLRSGPDTGYPRLARLKRGQNVWINGCLRNQAWCNVSSGRQRGWVQSSRLGTYERGNRVQRFDPRQLLSLSFLVFGQRRYDDDSDRLDGQNFRRAPVILERRPNRDRITPRERDRLRRILGY